MNLTRADKGPRTQDSGLSPSLILISLVLLVKVLYIVRLCPYNLVEDEAQYWLWSRHLDWSYYSKGPGIAWVIWASTRLFGDAEWGVRLPTVLAQSIGALACAGLARGIARASFTPERSASPPRAALFAAGAYLLAPAFQLTGILATIDGCYLACWALACWLGWRALWERSRWAWIGLGLALGVGFLFKYTILLLPPGLAASAVIARRSPLSNRVAGSANQVGWIAFGTAVLALVCAPVVYWNAREGWPTVHHLLGHLGVAGGDMPVGADSPATTLGQRLLWMGGYLGAPLGMFGPMLLLAVVAARRRLRGGRSDNVPDGPARARRAAAAYLLCCAAPILLFYLAVSLIAEPEQNWAIGGMASLMVLAGWFAADELARQRSGIRGPGEPRTRPIQVLWRVGMIYGVCAALILHRADLAAAALNRVAALPTVATLCRFIGRPAPAPVVLGRLTGAPEMGRHVRRLLDGLAPDPSAGGAPFVVCEHYGRASQMTYELFRLGLADVPVLSSQSIMGGRASQFDYWADTSLARSDLLGRAAVLMSNDQPQKLALWKTLFDRVTPLDTPDHKLDGEHKRDRIAYFGYGYRGPSGPVRVSATR